VFRLPFGFASEATAAAVPRARDARDFGDVAGTRFVTEVGKIVRSADETGSGGLECGGEFGVLRWNRAGVDRHQRRVFQQIATIASFQSERIGSPPLGRSGTPRRFEAVQVAHRDSSCE